MKPYPWVDNIEPYIEQFLREQTCSPIVSIPTFLKTVHFQFCRYYVDARNPHI